MTDVLETNVDAMSESDSESWALLADALPVATVPSAARASFHALIKGRERFAPFAREVAASFNTPLESVRSAFSRIDDASAWVPLPVPGLRILPMHTTNRGSVVIGRLRASTRIPRHTHRTREVTYVLDGVLMADGAQHGRAACLDMPEGSEHELSVSPAEDCLVVFASPPPS